MGVKDYYAALGIDRRESFTGIHKAYRQLAKECHPDRVGGQGTQRFQEVQEAYEVLSDPGKRKKYDASITRHRPLSTAAHTVEPLVSPPHSPEFFRPGPEPLVSPSAHTARQFAGQAGWTFGHGLGRTPRHVLPCCSAANHQEEIEELIMWCLRALRIDPF
jgi:curved DNA-binding protein CbpA